MHHHSTAEIVFGLFFFFPLPVCLFMDGWVVVMSMHTLTRDCDVSFYWMRVWYPLFGEDWRGNLWIALIGGRFLVVLVLVLDGRELEWRGLYVILS